MKDFCGVCDTEKTFDYNNGKYKRCRPCNIKHVMAHYHKNREILLEKNKLYYQNNKEYFRDFYKKRTNKILELQNQINNITDLLEAISVS